MARILVADDNDEIRQLLETIMSSEGHKVVSASNGQEALDMMLAHAPDVLILDVMMPVMDGYSVLREMKAAGMRDSTKVLVLTAKTSEQDWVRGYKLGADQYLTKPFEVDDLVTAVQGMLKMTKEQLRARRQEELDRAQLLSRLESIFQD
jgi:two-component system OmpR family response regulator